MGIHTFAQKEEVKSKTRQQLELGTLRQMMETQSRVEKGAGWMQVGTILAAERIIHNDLNWYWPPQSYDGFINELVEKADYYRLKMFSLTPRQIEWAADFLQTQYNRASGK